MSDVERPPQTWINNAVDRRLMELGQSLERAHTELRDEIRRGDRQSDALSRVEERLKDIRAEFELTRKTITDGLMTKEEFKPYKNGIVLVLSTVGLAVLGGLLRLVVLQR